MEVLYVLLVLLVATRLFGEVALRLGQPALVGELLSGVALGMIARGYSDSLPVLASLPDNEVFVAVAELGVFFLMLLAGLEMKPRELTGSSGRSIAVAVCGMLIPLGAGMGVGWLFLPDSDYRFAQMLFLGVAMAITAVPVVVKVLRETGALDSAMGRTVIAAALIDDILSLVLLAVLTAVVQRGELPSWLELGGLMLQVVGFFIIATVVGTRVLPWLGRRLRGLMLEEMEFSFLLVVAFGFSILAELMGMHFIIGAFFAGLLFSRRTVDKSTFDDVTRKVSGLTTGFLAPIFFASIGMQLDVTALSVIPGLVTLLVLVAFLAKFVGCYAPAKLFGMSHSDAAAVGVAMSARGAVELVIADIALRAGLFEHPEEPPPEVAQLFSAVVIVAIVTTLLVPLTLPWIFRIKKAAGE